MRKVVLGMSVSLDGYIEGPDRDITWHLVDEELHQHFNDEARELGAFLDGRVTYELMAGYWPTADSDPSSSPQEVEFAQIWREKPKYVYSRTLEKANWNTTIVRDVVPDEVMGLKAEPGGDLGLDGADLAATFLRLRLVDEIRIYVHPVVIGDGKPLFPKSGSRVDLELEETQRFGNGVVLLRYRVRQEGAVPTPS